METLRIFFMLLVFNTCLIVQGQNQFSTIEFVEVLNDNRDEARYYYEHNWKAFRQKALRRGKISGFHLLETKKTEDAPFDFILMTSFADEETYLNAEINFQAIIEEADAPSFLNEKRPSDFRKSVAVKEKVRHLE